MGQPLRMSAPGVGQPSFGLFFGRQTSGSLCMSFIKFTKLLPTLNSVYIPYKFLRRELAIFQHHLDQREFNPEIYVSSH